MIPGVGYTLNTHYRAAPSTNTMVQTYLDDSSLRLMGMLMTISLGIFAILFLYVLYNMTVNVAGTTIAMLFFIALAFFIILMKTFKLLSRFIANSQSNANFDSESGISTISEFISQSRARHDSAPPPYEEAIKNCPPSHLANAARAPVIVSAAALQSECTRCPSVQLPPEQ